MDSTGTTNKKKVKEGRCPDMMRHALGANSWILKRRVLLCSGACDRGSDIRVTLETAAGSGNDVKCRFCCGYGRFAMAASELGLTTLDHHRYIWVCYQGHCDYFQTVG
jgi:hypothetical protein